MEIQAKDAAHTTVDTLRKELHAVQTQYGHLRNAIDQLIKLIGPISGTNGPSIPLDKISECAIPYEQNLARHSDQQLLVALAFWPKNMHRLQSRLKQRQKAMQTQTFLWTERNSNLLHRNMELKSERKDLLDENHRLMKELESIKQTVARKEAKPAISSIIISDQSSDALKLEMNHKNRIIERLEDALDTKSAMIERLGNMLNQRHLSETNTCALATKHNLLVSRTIVLSPKEIGRFSCCMDGGDGTDGFGDIDSEDSISTSERSSASISSDDASDVVHLNNKLVDGDWIRSEDEDEISPESTTVVESENPQKVLSQNAIWILMTAHINANKEHCRLTPTNEKAPVGKDFVDTSPERPRAFCDADDEVYHERSEGQEGAFPASSIGMSGLSESTNGRSLRSSDEMAPLGDVDLVAQIANINAVTAFSRFLYGNIPETTDSGRSSVSKPSVLSWFSSDEEVYTRKRIRFDFDLNRAVLGALRH